MRSNLESANLRAFSDSRDVTAAETIKTTQTVMFPGAEILALVEKCSAETEENARATVLKRLPGLAPMAPAANPFAWHEDYAWQ